MQKLVRSTLMLLPLLLNQPCAQADPIGIFGVAGQYNVFLIGDPGGARPNGGTLNLTDTDVEGRAAARGDVTLTNFAIGTGVSDETGISSLVAGQSMTLNT